MSGRSGDLAGGLDGGADHPGLLPGPLVADPDVDTARVARSTRDWIVDLVTFAFAIALNLLVYAVLATQGGLPPDPVFALDVGFGALACVALWWRRRWPVTLAVVLGLASVGLTFIVGASLVALFTVVVHRRFTIAAPIAALHVAASLPYQLLYPDPTMAYWPSIAWAVGVIAVVTAWAMFVRARRQLVLSLRDRALRAEEEQQLRADQARRAERARIAREMHDVLAHRLSLVSTYAGALEFRRTASPDEVARAAGVIRGSAHQALQDLREVIGVLREDAGDGDDETDRSGRSDRPERPQPTLVDLPDLVEESRRAGMRITWESHVADPERVPEGVGRNAYRVVQEGLTNARKHARDTSVTVAVDGDAGDGLQVEIRNPMPVGEAVSPAIPGSGSGLVGLRERASLAGGRLEHGRTGDGEFRLRAWLPWPA